VPGQLQAMRGVLSVLGLDQAAQAALRMRDEVDSLASTEIDFERAGARGVFERLANNLGALGFLIDMLSVQPQMAKSLFRYDAAKGFGGRRLMLVMSKAKAEQLGVLVFMHPQGDGAAADLKPRLKGSGGLDNAIGNPLETTIALSHLIFEGTLDRFPGLKICAAHGGGYLP